MHDTYETLAANLLDALAALPAERQFWLGIAGAPGSGKSTLSRAMLTRFGNAAIVLPMDGYHLYRAELDAMPDPEEAHRRRGAPFTFKAEKFVADLTVARRSGHGWFPSFQHGVGDPVEQDIGLKADQHRLVLVEGNYLLLDDAPWCQLRSLFDESWFLKVDTPILHERLKQRFMGNGLSETAALERVESNDLPNAKLVNEQSLLKADRIVVLQ